jgi:hypothetical protein
VRRVENAQVTTPRTGRPADPPAAPLRRPSPTPRPTVAEPALDYYLVRSGRPDGGRDGPPEGIVVEEFVSGPDHSVLRVDSAAWTPGGPGWWTSPDLSRSIRRGSELRGRIVGVPRHEIAEVYRQLGGGTLPDEESLRGYLAEGVPRPTSAPLLLDLTGVTPGFHDTRVYRVLFAHDLGPEDLAHLSTVWRMTRPGDPTRAGGVLGTAHRRVGVDAFRWELRRIGTFGAYCLDLTVDLATGRDDAVRPVLRELTLVLRTRGLIPVTVERFA